MNWSDYVLMALFLASVCIVGGLFAKKSKSTNDHLLGGAKMPWWAAGISYVMALLSTASLVMVPGEAYNNGLRLYIAEWFAPVTGLIFFFIFMRFYFLIKTFTPFAYLERRFDVRVRAIISAVFLLTRISILSMILYSCAMVFKGMANWRIWSTILLLGVVSTTYCTLGGFRAVIWTNVLQFFVLGGGILVTMIVCLNNVDGGMSGAIGYAFDHGRGFNFEKDFFSFDPHVRLTFWLMMISSISAYMFYNSSDQIAIQQLLSTDSYKTARRSFITSVLIFLPLGAVSWLMGLAVFAYFGQNPIPEGNPPGDLALFTFVKLKMPHPFPGLLGSAMLAAAISTVGSMILSLTTVAAKDFYLRFFRPRASETQQVRFSRTMTVVFGVLATTVAILMSQTSKALGETLIEASTMWIAITTVIAPIFFIGVVNPRCNANHALACIVIGGAATLGMVIWYLTSRAAGNPISFMCVQVPGFILPIIIGVILPFFIGESPSREATENLTIWTLKRNAQEQKPDGNDDNAEDVCYMPDSCDETR